MAKNLFSNLCLCVNLESDLKTINIEEKKVLNNTNINCSSSKYNDSHHSNIGSIYKDSKKILRNHLISNQSYSRKQSTDSNKLINKKIYNRKKNIVSICDENKLLNSFIEKVDYIIDDFLKRKSVSESSESSDEDKNEQ